MHSHGKPKPAETWFRSNNTDCQQMFLISIDETSRGGVARMHKISGPHCPFFVFFTRGTPQFGYCDGSSQAVSQVSMAPNSIQAPSSIQAGLVGLVCAGWASCKPTNHFRFARKKHYQLRISTLPEFLGDGSEKVELQKHGLSIIFLK